MRDELLSMRSSSREFDAVADKKKGMLLLVELQVSGLTGLTAGGHKESWSTANGRARASTAGNCCGKAFIVLTGDRSLGTGPRSQPEDSVNRRHGNQ